MVTPAMQDDAKPHAYSTSVDYPARVSVDYPEGPRRRWTVFFRLILAFPHLLLVGGSTFLTFGSATGMFDGSFTVGWPMSIGVLGVVVVVTTFVTWFLLVLGNAHPRGLWDLASLYLRWRTRAVAYAALLRDDYPPFGDGEYPVTLDLDQPPEERDRVSILLRIFFAIPHIIIVWLLGLAWGITSIIAWVVILVTGEYPRNLYDFGAGVLRWSIRVEAYLLLLTDEYPPFSLQ